MVMLVSDRAGGNRNGCKYGQFVKIWTIKKRKRRQDSICIFLPKQIKQKKHKQILVVVFRFLIRFWL